MQKKDGLRLAPPLARTEAKEALAWSLVLALLILGTVRQGCRIRAQWAQKASPPASLQSGRRRRRRLERRAPKKMSTEIHPPVLTLFYFV